MVLSPCVRQLISARYATWGSGSWSTDNKYSTNSITYDLNGNILSMSQNWNGTLADNLTYVNYGNKLVGVDDAVTDSPVTNDFEDHAALALLDPRHVWCLPGLGKNAEKAPEFALIFGGKRGTGAPSRGM